MKIGLKYIRDIIWPKVIRFYPYESKTSVFPTWYAVINKKPRERKWGSISATWIGYNHLHQTSKVRDQFSYDKFFSLKHNKIGVLSINLECEIY